MKAKLYGLLNNYVGSVELPDTRGFPKLLELDESSSPEGGIRLFLHNDFDYYDEVSNKIPRVKLLQVND